MLNKKRYLNEDGIDGSGNKVYAVVTEWNSAVDGRALSFIAKFDTKAEALCWLKWC